MQTVTHKGNGTIDTPKGRLDVAYFLTVTRTATAEDGYGYIQSREINFGELFAAGRPLDLQIETGSNLKIVLTSAAGERAVFGSTEGVPGSLFVG